MPIDKIQELKYKSFCIKLRQHLILTQNGHSFDATVNFILDGDIPKAHIIIDSAYPAFTAEFKEALPLPKDLPGLEVRVGQLFSAHINRKLDIMLNQQQVEEKVYTVILVDGNNLAHRCKHTYKLSYQGSDTSIPYGVLRSLSTLYHKFNPYRIIVCFDQGFPARRRELVPSYKISRHNGDNPEDYAATREQIANLYDWLPRFGIFTSRLENYEADDLIAQYSRYLPGLFNQDRQRVLIISGDKDLYQLVSDRVDVCDPMKTNKLITLENFKEVTGVASESYLLYRALMGDSSDEVPGVYGIGEVKAARIVEKYPTLNALRLGILKRSVPDLNSFETKSLLQLIKDTYDCIDLFSQRFPKIMAFPLNFLEEPLAWKTLEAELLLRGFQSLVTDDYFREMVNKFNTRHGLVGYA